MGPRVWRQGGHRLARHAPLPPRPAPRQAPRFPHRPLWPRFLTRLNKRVVRSKRGSPSRGKRSMGRTSPGAKDGPGFGALCAAGWWGDARRQAQKHERNILVHVKRKSPPRRAGRWPTLGAASLPLLLPLSSLDTGVGEGWILLQATDPLSTKLPQTPEEGAPVHATRRAQTSAPVSWVRGKPRRGRRLGERRWSRGRALRPVSHAGPAEGPACPRGPR